MLSPHPARARPNGQQLLRSTVDTRLARMLTDTVEIAGLVLSIIKFADGFRLVVAMYTVINTLTSLLKTGRLELQNICYIYFKLYPAAN